MVTASSQIATLYPQNATNQPTSNPGASSSGDFLDSFKDVFALMSLSSSLPGSTAPTQPGLGMSDLLAPLMLLLLEKLVELEVEVGETSSGSNLLTLGSRAEPSGRPVSGVLTQDYHPGHNGLDFGVAVGTPIQATMDGKVVYAGWNNQGYGNLVIVENGAYRTYYAHLDRIPVTIGTTVTAGTVIGLSGNTGNSTGPHLHYEIRKNLLPIDPTSVTLGS